MDFILAWLQLYRLADRWRAPERRQWHTLVLHMRRIGSAGNRRGFSWTREKSASEGMGIASGRVDGAARRISLGTDRAERGRDRRTARQLWRSQEVPILRQEA